MRRPRQHVLYVYLIQAKVTKFLKIGVSGNPFRRARCLRPTCGQDTVLLDMIVGGFCVERETHQMFADDRLMGEWFKDSHEIKQWFNVHPKNATMTEEEFDAMKAIQKNLLLNQIKRNLVGRNLAEISRHTDISLSTISKALKMDASIMINNVHALCNYLGIDIPKDTP